MLFAIIKTFVKFLLGKGVKHSYSQFGEDAVVGAFFRSNNDGYYVDVGAYHPHLYSNTYALYRRGWHGLAIDPNPAMQPLFKLFRSRDTFVCAGVGEGEGSYQQFADGAYNQFTKGAGQKLRRLDDLLHEHHVEKIDFLSIDVEGMDVEVLKTHDWSIRPRLIAIEADLQSPAAEFLTLKGYTLRCITGRTLILADE
ncbi:MAG: FkbM family methyltransferase [Candidatus Pacebacteria bacterium]|nr:FkbM family methyltransferase [Candidatus Paceibacterota bacterium]